MKTFFSLVCALSFSMAYAQQISIIPKPVSLTTKAGNFVITPNTTIVGEGEDEKKAAVFFNDYLQQLYGFKLKTGKKPAKNSIILSTKKTAAGSVDGKYTMNISSSEINITGDTHQGTFYGIQTLIQLLPT
ncbi:MAG: glycoside hydrolase family 20 zincin-like fold domain-containing protein, partial [Bacteroidetes bacterium]|nr:glycoside hydrolase family 20 zincin-like fold domain-containing protein [Bacteroidota bacterium]